MAEIHRVDRDTERLQHGAVGGGDPVRQRVQQLGGPGDELLERAVLLAVPGEPDPHAQIAVALLAQLADAAGDCRVHGDRLAMPRAALDHTGGLVPDHQRAADTGVADATLGVPVQIRPAQPDRGHPDQAVSGRHLRHRLLGEPDVADAVQPRDLHQAAPPCNRIMFQDSAGSTAVARPSTTFTSSSRRGVTRSGASAVLTAFGSASAIATCSPDTRPVQARRSTSRLSSSRWSRLTANSVTAPDSSSRTAVTSRIGTSPCTWVSWVGPVGSVRSTVPRPYFEVSANGWKMVCRQA